MMKNRKLVVMSEVVNSLIDTNGGPIDLTTLFEMVKERTGAKEEEFGGDVYLMLGLLKRFNFIDYGDHFHQITIGQNFNDNNDFGVVTQTE